MVQPSSGIVLGPRGVAVAIGFSSGCTASNSACNLTSQRKNVKLYEQAAILREVGTGINIGTDSWNVLGLLGVADSLTTGHPEWTVLNMNGHSGEELHRGERTPNPSMKRPTIRTQRTTLQSALPAHVPPGTIQLSKKLSKLVDAGDEGLELHFKDNTTARADLVIGADGIRSAVRDTAWPDYEIAFTGTTIWRTLLPLDAVRDLGPRFQLTGWWHTPTTHVYFSPVGEGLWEIAARAYHDPATHRASKVSWGVPVANAHLARQAEARRTRLEEMGGEPSYDDRVRNKIITDGGEDMSWIYMHDIGAVWADVLGSLEDTTNV
ncbi:FAD/NAD P-binding domain-containing protein [Apiospora aurea]|uniref:FAD/NAD P-binding domain-containing protein n=1 Tax=Apiospora aurea TaxID=335848 RepID=A0ABR1PZX1_9PEZI